MTLEQLAQTLGAELRCLPAQKSAVITAVAAIATAGPGALIFAEEKGSRDSALLSNAAAVLMSPSLATVDSRMPQLVVKQPKLAFAHAARLLQGAAGTATIHPTAVIAPDAFVAGDAAVGAHAVIESGARVGARSSIGAGAVLGHGVLLGEDCRIYPRVVLYANTTLGNRVVVHAGAVLGSDGFGYVRDAASGAYTQFPQQGVLVIEDDVEIGANTTIDRGALEETRIGRGTKIDNLVHLGHNVRVGRNVVIAALTGVSGSTTIGDNAVIGGQVGIGDHASIGDGVILGSQAGVLPHKKLRRSGEVLWGTPAKPLKQYLRELAALAKLARSARRDEQ